MIQKKQKYRCELIPNTPCRVFIRNYLAELKIECRGVASKQILWFKKKLGLDSNKCNFDEKDVISALQLAFEGEIMYTQYRAKENQIDHVFPKRKLGVEIDENGHVDRDPDCKKKDKN